MTAITFDTLQASHRLREAGVDEVAAKAIVEVVSQTASMPDVSGFATKSDIQLLRSDLDAAEHRIKAEFNAKLLSQLWAFLAGVAAIVGAATAIIKLVP